MRGQCYVSIVQYDDERFYKTCMVAFGRVRDSLGSVYQLRRVNGVLHKQLSNYAAWAKMTHFNGISSAEDIEARSIASVQLCRDHPLQPLEQDHFGR
jgi:hypothetical protein